MAPASTNANNARAQLADARARQRPQRGTRAPRRAPLQDGPTHLTPLDKPTVRTFKNSTVRVIPGDPFWGPLIGKKAATVTHHPLLAQSNSKADTKQIVKGPQSDTASLEIRRAIGRAISSKPNEQVYRALRKAHTAIKNDHGKDSEWYRRSRLAYAIATFKDGQLSVAKKSLRFFLTEDAPEDNLTLMAYITLADIHMGEGMLTISKDREKAFEKALDILTSQIPILLGAFDPSDDAYKLVADVYYHITNVFMEYHYPESAKKLARALIKAFPDSEAAHKILSDESPIAMFVENGEIIEYQDISIWDRLSASAKEFVNRAKHDSNAGFWISATSGSFAGLGLGTLLTDHGFDYSSGLGWAAAGGVLLTSAVKAYKGYKAPETKQAWHTGHSERDFSDFMKSSAIEATKLAATAILCGVPIPGLENVPTGVLDIPKFGPVPDMLMTEHASGMRSPVNFGSLQTFLYSAFGTWGSLLGNHIASEGFVSGLNSFSSIWAKETIYGQATMNGIHAAQDAASWLWNMDAHIPALASNAFEAVAKSNFWNPNQWTLNGMAKTALNLYIGAAGAYSVGSIVAPGLVNKAHQAAANTLVTPDMTEEDALAAREQASKYTSWAEASLAIGAYIAAKELGLASGMDTIDAFVIPLICYMTILRQHFMSGGRARVAEMDWTKIYMAGVVQLFYIAPGNQIRAGVEAVNVYDYLELGMALAPFLVFGPGLLHGFFQGYTMERVVTSKVTKAPTTGLLGDAGSLMFGWDAWPAMFYKIFVKELGLSAFVSQTDREISGNSQQYKIFAKQIKRLSDMMGSGSEQGQQQDTQAFETTLISGQLSDKLKKLKTSMMNSADSWQTKLIAAEAQAHGGAWKYIQETLKNPTPIERAFNNLNLFFVKPKTDEIDIPTRIDCDDYRAVIFQCLMDASLSEAQRDQLFNMIEVILTDNSITDKNDMKANLAITLWASRFGPHGAKVRGFVEEKYPTLKEIYSLPDDINFNTSDQSRVRARLSADAAYPPKGYKWRGAKKWFNKNLSTGLSGVDKEVQSIYDTIAQSGRRWLRHIPLTGRAVTENLSILTAFMKSLRSGHNQDPTFATRPDTLFYQNVIFKMLMDRGTERSQVQTLLTLAENILSRTGDQLRRDVQHNLLMTIYGARKGPHAAEIADFLKDNSWMLSFHGISRDVETPKSATGFATRRWFDNHLIWSDVSVDGIKSYPEKSKPAQFQGDYEQKTALHTLLANI